MSQHAGPPSGGHNHMQGSGMLTQPTSPNATVMKYPLRINNSMVLHRPGQIMFAEPAFHTRNAFYPINYCLLRLFQCESTSTAKLRCPALQDPTRQGYWRCEVLYHPGCPVFRITEDSAPANSFSSRDIDQVVADLRLSASNESSPLTSISLPEDRLDLSASRSLEWVVLLWAEQSCGHQHLGDSTWCRSLSRLQQINE